MQRVVSRRWAQADQHVVHAKQRGIDARGAAGHARAAWGKAERAFDEAVQVDTAAQGIQAALACVRPDGQRNDRAWAQAQAQAQITAALGALGGEAWGKVRRLLNDARPLHHLDWVHAQLEQAVSDPLLREAVVRMWYGRGHLERAHGTLQVPAAPLVVVAQLLCQRLSPDWPLEGRGAPGWRRRRCSTARLS